MDFDIGNILYIVITLVAVIVGLLGKKKKTPARNAEPGEQAEERQPGFMENLEKALRMGQEDPSVMELRDNEPDLLVEEEEPQQEVEPVEIQTADRIGILEEYERMLEQRSDTESDIILADGDSTLEPLEVIHLEEQDGTDYFEIIKDFDAGTAVVYSAIINRVDY